jgi:hypothetical protein
MRTSISFLRTPLTISMARRLHLRLLIALVICASCAESLTAQPFNNAPAQNAPNALVAPPGGQQNGLLLGPNPGQGRQGGAANADFDSLIELITSTIHPEMWADNGGTGDIRPFPGGVFVDAEGTLRLKARGQAANDLIAKRGSPPVDEQRSNDNPRRSSALRYISLPRLERDIARRHAAGEALDPAMLTLAGLRRAQYVFVYPESGDLVLAGPAGDWRIDVDGRIVSAETGSPVVRLDDLLILLRRGADAADSHFGCSINPRQQSLAKTQAFLAATSQEPLAPEQRKKWLSDLRDTVGRQDIEVFGVDPSSHVAGVLVEADYHMKLVGMGLADGVAGVESYLASVKLASGDSPPPMSVLRWWFTLDYDSIASSPAGDAFELVGQGVRVLSESELLAAHGQRVHTGQSDPLNRHFAESFTAHFNELVAKYPVYGELRNIFDLAMAVALIQREGLVERAGWQPDLLASHEQLRLPQGAVPRQVETVINHRVINRRHVVAGVSGGVMVAPADMLKESQTDSELAQQRRAALPSGLPNRSWWWDTSE